MLRELSWRNGFRSGCGTCFARMRPDENVRSWNFKIIRLGGKVFFEKTRGKKREWFQIGYHGLT